MNKPTKARQALCEQLRAYTFRTLDDLRRSIFWEILDADREHRALDFAPIREGFDQLAARRATLRADLAAFDAGQIGARTKKVLA